MAAFLWMGVVLALECTAVLFFIPPSVGSLAVAILFAGAFLTVCWACGAFRKDTR
ncbi:hypothetical protein J2Y69_002250 [Microbacterium resistens]|uniref:Uncharacterized protein n=1 Tax=Microbacterium resistens TaxID=156977 RepID=A0ABU1SDF5_9MICO|nr:hypothetical protein [Microbacterium resistens]